jgi:hypothetical protein
MSLFANRWRTLREAASTEVASSAVQPQPIQQPRPEPVKKPGNLRQRLPLQQDELRA